MSSKFPFALFVDVMGVQQLLLATGKAAESVERFQACCAQLEDFHNDLSTTIDQSPLRFGFLNTVAEPNFVAEFSDSAYIVGDNFASVAIPAILLMRKAIRHNYPLRGGIGVGSFSHEASGVRARPDAQIWSTSSFLGSSVVTAYRAERSLAAGLRILVHPDVMRRNTEGFLKPYTMQLRPEEVSPDSSHELRIWQSSEAPLARERLIALRDSQQLSDRAKEHYSATESAYEGFELDESDLPNIGPAIWL